MYTVQIYTMPAIADLYGLPQDRESAISAGNNWRVCAFILLLFVLAATLSAMRKDVTRGFDEVAHASYIAHLQHTGDTWPALNEMRMLDPSSFRFTGEKNYLNHPSLYYALLARLGPNLEGHPGAIIVYRLFNVVFAAIGLTAFMAIGLIARLPRLSLYAYIIPLACIPVLAPIAGSINNDNIAFAGGGIATLAALQLLTKDGRASLMAALGGVIVASWAKFTALLLVGGMMSGVLAWLLWHRRLQPRSIVLIAIAALLAISPYVVLFAQYGSPTPNTVGQIAMVTTGAHAVGWDSAERMSLAAYVVHFVSVFIIEWMPTLEPRNALNYTALLIPVAAALCAFLGLVMSAHRIARGNATPIDIVVVASGLAFTTTFVIHVAFSYERHVVYGWMLDAYPRYYLPLASFFPLAGLSLLAAIKCPRVRAILVGFLIASPVIFRLLGAPLR
jgi:hypothetical protein